MQKFLKEYLSFSRSEIRVILIICILILISLILRLFIHYPDSIDLSVNSDEQSIADSFILSLGNIETLPSERPWERSEYRKVKSEFIKKTFDPNQVTAEDLEKMGVPQGICKSILNYRKAGGSFRKKEDLKKIYGFNDSLFMEYENFILIEKSLDTLYKEREFRTMKMVDLNLADSSDLIGLNGIGPYYASKILNYRRRLGGFYNLNQLLEIKGLDSSKITSVSGNIKIDTLQIIKIDINKVTINELKQHPYIKPRLAEAIISYRKFAGKVKSPDELLKNNLITTEELMKLCPYLFFGN